MSNEYEIISHSIVNYVNIFVVHLVSRTPHIHRDLELGILLEGSLTVRTGGKLFTLEKDDAYLMNSMEAHEFVSGGGALILAFQFSPVAFSSFVQGYEQHRFITDPPIREAFAGTPVKYPFFLSLCSSLAIEYIRGSEKEYRCLAMATCLFNLLCETIPMHSMNNTDYLPMRNRTERLVSVTDFIDSNFRRKLLLEEVAEREGLSLYHLSHLFRNTLGISFQEYVKQKRFEYACRLIASTDMTILDISLDSGFSDVRYLNNMFRKEYGCSPSEYRANRERRGSGDDFLSDNTQYFLPREDSLAVLLPFHQRFSSEAGSLTIEELFHPDLNNL